MHLPAIPARISGGNEAVRGAGYLNDLWEFNPAAKTWTWVSGSSTANAIGVYGIGLDLEGRG